jgi:hypothetical protein
MLTCTVLVHHPVPARYTRYASIFLRSFLSFLLLFLSVFLTEVYMRNAWTTNDNGTKPSLGRGRSPKRIGQNTLPSRGTANIAGFDPPTLSAWSDTGADCEPPKRSPLEPRPPRQLSDGWEGLQ